MIGWRGRIGLLIPAPNTVIEYEFPKMSPEGVSIHISRIHYPETTNPQKKENNLIKMGSDAIHAAQEIACIKPDVIAFCCTSGSFIKGEGYNREIIKNIEKTTGIPTVTTSSAVLEVFKKLKLKKIVMATPYHKEVVEKEVEYFEKNIPGFKILATNNLGIIGGLPKGNLYPPSAHIAAKEVYIKEAEAIFISCTNWRTIEIINLLERDTGKPVITSNQATMWAILRKIGICSGNDEYGQLLSSKLDIY